MSLHTYGVVGSGAIGALYGSRLFQAGHSVRFLLRSDLEIGLKRGLRVRSLWGNVTVPATVLCGDPAQLGAPDVILVATKSTANGDLSRLLGPACQLGTIILVLQNGIGGAESAAAAAPLSAVVGGVCDVCSQRVAPAEIEHTAYGLLHLAPLLDDDAGRQACAAVTTDLLKAGVPVLNDTNLRTMQWRKLVWNLPFNGMSVIAATQNMPAYAPSMKLEAAANRPLELETIYVQPTARAAACGVEMPESRALLAELQSR